MKLLWYYVCFFGLASLAYPGTVIYSDFNAADVTYQGGWGIYGTSNSLVPGAYNSMAMAFTPDLEASLTSIDVAISWESGTNSVVLSLDSDNSGAPGGVIASWMLNNLPSVGFCCAAETVTANSFIALAAGTQYWVTAAPGASDTDAVWTNTNTLGLSAEQNALGGTFFPEIATLSAFSVNGSAVPEPISLFLVAAGLALLAGIGLVRDLRCGSSAGFRRAREARR